MMNKMRKMKNKKGFTLMEMLIVVAIIAILVAIAIPTFASSLNKARVAVDEANIRSGYAEVMTEVLMNGDNYNVETGDGNELTYYLKADGSVATEKLNFMQQLVRIRAQLRLLALKLLHGRQSRM